MKKIMYINFPQGSHILTSVYLCKELAKENVNLIYYTDKKYFKAFGDAKIDLRPYPDAFFDLYKARSDDQHLYHSIVRLWAVFFEFTEFLLPFIVEEIEREKPDFIICDHLAIWGKIALKKFNTIPAAFFFTNLIFRAEEKMVWKDTFLELLGAATYNLKYVFKCFSLAGKIKKRFGYMMWKPEEILDNKGDFCVVMQSRQFQPYGDKFADNYRFIGPGQITPPDYKKTERDVIFVFRGTVESDKKFWEVCFKALKDVKQKVIISYGGTKSFDFDPKIIPSNFQIVSNLNTEEYLAVLKRAALFISHGGVNSVSESLAYGTPLVVITNAFQNHPLGVRVKDLGCGEYFHRNKLTVNRLRDTVLKVLNDETYYENAEKVRQSYVDTMPLRANIVKELNKEFNLF